MNSNIFNAMGLSSLDPAIIILVLAVIAIVAIVCAVASSSKVKKLSTRIDSFMKGKEAKSLEENIVSIEEDNKAIKEYIDGNRKDIRRIYKNLEIAYQKVGLVRYDAFKETGGQLSFSLALLNDKNNGFVMNSVHSTNGCFVYSKAVENGTCAINLGEEEEQALAIALMGEKREK